MGSGLCEEGLTDRHLPKCTCRFVTAAGADQEKSVKQTDLVRMAGLLPARKKLKKISLLKYQGAVALSDGLFFIILGF